MVNAPSNTNGYINSASELRKPDELDPGLPHDTPCLSFWLGQTRSSKLLGLRSTEELPEQVDLAIIGSGFSGSATAYWYLKANPNKSVVLLESREICHGATGRNGGHCRPDCYRGYTSYKANLGKEQALKVHKNEWENFNLLEKVITEEGLTDKVDYVKCKTYDVAMDQGCADGFKEVLAAFRADGGNADLVEWLDAEEAKKATRAPDACGAAIFPASSLWPYKLVCALLEICLEKGLNIQTNTPVTKVVPSEGGSGGVLETPRGSIKATQIVHATNAYAGHLLEDFQGLITPFRGQCSQVTPTKPYSGSKMLTHTYSFRWRDVRNDFDYMIQRPADGSMIIGGGRWNTDITKLINQTDDSVVIPELTKYFETCMPAEYFKKDWGPEKSGEGLTRTWCGIMGYTHDAIPYVGELETRPGQFIIAGHSGHGMARIMSCSKAIAEMLAGASFESTGLPECFAPSSPRMSRYPFTVQQQWLNEDKNEQGTEGMLH